MEETSPKKQFPPTLAILLVLLLILLVVFLYSNRKKLESQTTVETVPNTEQQKPTQVPTSLTLTTFDRSSFVLGQPAVITVQANSHTQDVVGFDVLVTYDQSAFTFVKADAFDEAFSLYPRTASTHLSITGIKKPTVKDIKSFTNAPLLTLTFQSKKQGTYDFSLSPKIGKETTKMVNERTQIFNPKVENLTVEVK